ncbi:hypothetical protein BH23ACT12_BH23ACT12_10480 [soil metagenome]
MVGEPKVAPLNPRSVLLSNPFCAPLRAMYDRMKEASATSWDQIENEFLAAISEFDRGLPQVFSGNAAEKDLQSKQLSGALQNGKGDWFNNVLALLLERCAGIETLYVRRQVPGLIIAEHNLDGVFPGDESRAIDFLLEAKMMGTPKHANSPGQKAFGRAGSADTNKRVKELAFKSIDLKGEASRRLSHKGIAPTGGAGGGDLSTWLHTSSPRIYFFMAVRVVSDTDFAAVVRWAETAAQVVDAVGLYCYEFVPDSYTDYRRKTGIQPAYQLDRVLYRACTDLQSLKEAPPPPVIFDVPPSAAAMADELTDEATSESKES